MRTARTVDLGQGGSAKYRLMDPIADMPGGKHGPLAEQASLRRDQWLRSW